MKKQILPFLALLLLLFSCERYEDAGIDLPYKNKLVAVTFLEEGTDSVKVMLTRTQPIFGSPPLPVNIITDAHVSIHTSRETLVLEYNEETQQYTGKLTAGVLLAGETCSISVLQNNEEVTGSTVIPADVTPVIGVKADSVLENEIYWNIYDVRYRVQQSGTHHVIVSASITYSDSTSMPLFMDNGPSTGLRTLASGQEMMLRFRNMMPPNGSHPVRLEVHTQLCNEDYTGYQTSIESQDYSDIGSGGGEVLLVYSNMSNRIGITAAYNILPVVSRDL